MYYLHGMIPITPSFHVIRIGMLLHVLGEVKSHVVMKNMSEYVSYKIVKFISPLDLRRPLYNIQLWIF